MRIDTLRLLPLLLAAVLVSTSVQAADATDKDHMTGFKMPVKVGLNLNAPSSVGSDLRFTFAGGVGAEFYFVPNVGVFAGADFMNRGFKTGGASSSASFLDFPFGVAFQYRGGFGGDAMNTIKLGGFAAVPLGGTFTGPLGAGGSTSTYFGIMLESSMLFPVSECLSLGLTSWVKYGLGSGSSTFTTSKFLDFGFGLGARFF